MNTILKMEFISGCLMLILAIGGAEAADANHYQGKRKSVAEAVGRNGVKQAAKNAGDDDHATSQQLEAGLTRLNELPEGPGQKNDDACDKKRDGNGFDRQEP